MKMKTRREFLTGVVVAATLAVTSGSANFAEQPEYDFGDSPKRVAQKIKKRKISPPPPSESFLPAQVRFDGQTVETHAKWTGTTERAPSSDTFVWHPSRDGGGSGVVQTLKQAQQAARIALQQGQFQEVRIFMPQVQEGKNGGPPSVVWNKEEKPIEGGIRLAKPHLIYTSPDQVMVASAQEEQAAEEFAKQLAFVDELNGNNWTTRNVANCDRMKLIVPDKKLLLPGRDFQMGGRSDLMPVGLFNYGSQQANCNSCSPHQNQQCQSYAYTSSCPQGNCDLSVGSTIRGLFGFKFLTPVSHRMQHLSFGQRLIAMIFPRVAYRKGWIDCEVAHVLLTRRLLFIIIAGATAGIGGAAGGGGGVSILIP